MLGRNLEESSPFVEWVKEGRKYDLGAILVTQQPGSMASELLSQADNWFCFHLLSEGDASTLGRHNSHFSDDVLAHLIGEPIPGNCYMWSAPLQPFVLPVRVRSFEDLYRKNVKSGNAENAIATLAKEILDQTSGALGRLSEALVPKLREPNVKYVRFAGGMPSGEDAIGVASGQLYYVINEIKTASDTTPVDELKVQLLTLLFGEGVLTLLKHPQTQKEYFCAPMASWEKAGIRPPA